MHLPCLVVQDTARIAREDDRLLGVDARDDGQGLEIVEVDERQHLDLAPDQGGRFFAGYESETVARWREFGAWAEKWAEQNPSMQAAAVDAARESFVCFT